MKAAVVICTRNRPADLDNCLLAVIDAVGERTVLVWDASDGEIARETAAISCKHAATYVAAPRRGLARQRNDAAEFCAVAGTEILHFIDDDTIVSREYFSAIEERFEREPNVVGVGGIIRNQPVPRYLWFKSFFLVYGRHPGTVLKSGRPVMGQYPEMSDGDPEWLSGCSMSYRTGTVLSVRFDDRLTGYSLGEDYDFGFRVTRNSRVVVERRATCLHELSPNGRSGRKRLATERTLLGYAWVLEQRGNGMLLRCYWWSVLGDFLLHFWRGLFGSVEYLSVALGVFRGVVLILRKGPARAL